MSHPPDLPPLRVFFALWPTTAEHTQLAAWQIPLQRLCGGRVMRSETLHSTLVFVGSIGSDKLEALQQAAHEAGGENFELRFDAVHYWEHNHIVYAAPSHVPQQLTQLIEALEQRLIAHRCKFDSRTHQPHVTLLRSASWSRAALPLMQPVSWYAGDFVLVQSMLQGGRATYRVLARFPLRTTGG